MLGKDIGRIVLYGVGLSSAAAIVYLAGPFIAFGDWRPLENAIVRDIVIVLLIAAVAGLGGFHFWQRKKKSEKIAEGVAGEAKKEDSDSLVLRDRMKDALTTLRKASGGKGDYLYELPWYLLIGPPGAGKTTALVNSGLKFPLSGGATPAAIAGVGGTRYCDWWFTEEAVLIDTAGRYTTQDSDAKADQQSWTAFLNLLKKNRPRQPINGVMVAISLEDLMTLPTAEIAAHANAVRARLLELHELLKVDFPVYVLLTKADLVAGFMEYFRDLGEEGRQQVWGATFQTSDKTRNMVGEVPFEYDLLIERLSEGLTDRLQEEPAPNSRVLLFGFPTQMAALKRPIFDFLNQIFEPTRYHADATLRGFYFTSGTQQGTPIDRLIGSLAKSFGAEEMASSAYSGLGKSYFLTDLIKKVVIGEAAWVSTDRAAVRRVKLLRVAGYALVLLITLGLAGAWWTSYSHNKELVAQTDAAIADYRAAAGPIEKETTIADRDFSKVLPLLHRLRYLPTGYGNRQAPQSVWAGFGLSQRGRLESASDNAYRIGLERMFRTRLIYRMEEGLENNKNNSSYVYDALKVYMMLGGLHAPDRNLVLSWWRRDWAENLYPGSANEEGRKALEAHLTAMLDLDEGEGSLVGLNGPLIEESQRTLARLSVAQRAYELLKSQARSSSTLDWVPARLGISDFALVFEAANGDSLDSIRVPAFFTYAGFHRLFIDRLSDIAERIKSERWVLGTAGEQSAVAVQYDSLGPDLLALYTKDCIETWRASLAKLQLRNLTADKPKYVVLAAASAATSPLKQLLESIRDQTDLTREKPGSSKASGANKPSAAASAGTPTLLKQQGQAPGADIEAAFKAFHILVEGGATRRPIDAIVANLAEINQSLTLMATSPSQAAQAGAALQTQVAGLRANANRMPQPFQDMLTKAAATFDGELRSTAHVQLQRALGQVTGACMQVVPHRYPFEHRAQREVPLADFARLFAPNGIFDKFFTQHLAPLVDTSKKVWSWRQEQSLARSLSVSTLREFQRAAEIRDAFFSTGGNMPAVNINVIPPSLVGPDAIVKLEINGVAVFSKVNDNSPVALQWPGAGGYRTAVSVTPTSFGQPIGQPSVLEKTGVWSLFRLLDASSPVRHGDRIVASFIVGGRELQYQFAVGSIQNPLMLSALREFHCPNGI